MRNVAHDYSLDINPLNHIVDMIDALKESEKKSVKPVNLRLIVDDPEGYVYTGTKEFFQKIGYKIVKISLNKVYCSDQYAAIMDFFNILDREDVKISTESIATFLIRTLRMNFKEKIYSDEEMIAIKTATEFLNKAYEEGNVSFNDLLSELDSNGLFVGIIYKINISCKNIISGYDFAFGDAQKDKLVIYAVPPYRNNPGWETFLIPIILYLFKLYSAFTEKSELIITDIENIGVIPGNEVKEIADYLANENKVNYMIGYNRKQYDKGSICSSSSYLLRRIWL